MSIFEDARNGALTGTKIDSYLQSTPSILDKQDPSTGYTPLATAVVAGFPDEVDQLLKKGAKPDGLSRGGETPLLLATWKTTKERPRIVQLLVAKSPPSSIDSTTITAENKTPLMYAIENKDLDSIRILRRAKASLSIKNEDGFNAKEVADEVAEQANDLAVVRALYPDKEQSTLARLASTVLGFLLYIVAWVNEKINGLVRRASGLNPVLDASTDQAVNRGDESDKEKFLKNVDKFVSDNAVLERFFKDKKDFVREIAQKAANLKEDPETDLGDNDTLPKTVKVSLHQQVIYCDDSTSMKRESRWDNQKQLISRIANITTRVLPDGEGVALRFINREVENSTSLDSDAIGKIMDPMPWQPGGDTPIGTNLRSKILQKLVYDKIEAKTFDRPILVSIITDGMPEPEDKSTLVNAIVECGQKLDASSLPRDSVKFMIGQIGTATAATNFLNSLRDNTDIAPVVFVTTEKLDEKLADLRSNDRDLDRWLIETLFMPLKEAETKKDV